MVISCWFCRFGIDFKAVKNGAVGKCWQAEAFPHGKKLPSVSAFYSCEHFEPQADIEFIYKQKKGAND